MKKIIINQHQDISNKQKGASLFIALIVLLVVTLLALSSAREVTLESRITGNFTEQQITTNSAESGLRNGERAMITTFSPLEPQASPDCTSIQPCFLNLVASNNQNFTHAQAYKTSDETTLNKTTKWYSQIAPSGESNNEAENPEYGNMMLGIGTFRYEVNSRATNNQGSHTYLRSTTAKVFSK